ncbi:hypothetical protein TNCV_1033541 [Trichonephila clavipes]|nr:hypothetical protein TNCV_1033541 [Trichonephila clavipes]
MNLTWRNFLLTTDTQRRVLVYIYSAGDPGLFRRPWQALEVVTSGPTGHGIVLVAGMSLAQVLVQLKTQKTLRVQELMRVNPVKAQSPPMGVV